MPEITPRRGPGRPKKNTKEAIEIATALFSTSTQEPSPSDHALNDTDMSAIVQEMNVSDPPIVNDVSLQQPSVDDAQKAAASDPAHEANKTWASTLKPSAKGMSLTFIEPCVEGATIETTDIADEIPLWANTLVGSFLGSKPTIDSVRSFVQQFWNAASTPEVLYYKRGWYYFRFKNKEDCLAILHDGPWILGNSTLILKEWSPDSSSELEATKVVPVWTIFKDLDPWFWSHLALSKIASLLGKPLYADSYTTDNTRISFARVLIEMDISKDLTYSLSVNTPYGPKVVAVEYEWVPYFCTRCDRLGHQTSRCKKNQALSGPSNVKQVWRPVSKLQPVTDEVPVSATAKQQPALGAVLEAATEVATVVSDVSVTAVPDVSVTAAQDGAGFKAVVRQHSSPKSNVPGSFHTPIQSTNSLYKLTRMWMVMRI